MLSEAALIFVCQFFMVFLLGTQSQFVRDAKILEASITSLLLGIAGWTVTGVVSSAYASGIMTVVYFSFILAGPVGIASSIWLHRKLKGNK